MSPLKNLSSFSQNINIPYSTDFKFTDKDTNRNHIVRFNIYKEATGQAQDYVLFKSLTNAVNVVQDIALPNFVATVSANQEFNYGYAEISSVFKNATNSASETVAKTIDLSTNQVSGLNYSISTGPSYGTVNISNSTNAVYTSYNYSTNFTDKFVVELKDGTTSLGFQTNWVNVSAVNEAPTALNLSNSTLAENVPANTIVGNLSTADPDAGNTHTYSLVSGTGDTDNSSFSIVNGNQLRINTSPDYESKNIYNIRLRTTDQGGLSLERTLAVNITDVNEAPTALNLSNSTLAENVPANTIVGNLSTADPDAGNTHTYSLVSGTGDTDNSSFSIVNGNQLRINTSPDYESKNIYNIRLRTTDQGGLSLERTLAVNITDVNEAPTVANPVINQNWNYGSATNLVFPANTFTDVDIGDVLTYTANGLPPGITFNSGTRTFSGTPTASGNYSVNLIATDLGNLKATNNFTISVAKGNLTATAGNTNGVYGNTIPNLDNLVTVTGLVNGDTVTKSASTTATQTSPKGNFPITPAVTGSASTNYNFNYVNGTFTVDPATLLVSSDNKTKNYGDNNPTLTGSISGIRNNDDLSLTFNTSATTNSPFGSYPINLSIIDPNGKLSNYTTSTNLGSLNIGRANLNVGTLATNAFFGDNIPTITAYANGFTPWDATNIVVNGSTTATNRSNAGSYTTSVNLSGSGLESILSNYNVATNLSQFNILPRGVSLFANGFTNVYGDIPPVVTWGMSNLVSPDSVNVFSGIPNITHSVNTNTVAGTNSINIDSGTLTNQNYTITNNVGASAVTVTAPLTFNILGTNVLYRTDIPNLNVQVSGAKNGDFVSGTANTGVTNGSPVGNYNTFLTAISGPSQFNLRYGPITTNAGNVNVFGRGLELKALNSSFVYGDLVNIGNNWQVNGLQAGDNISGAPNINTPAVQGSNVGTYSANISQGTLNAGPNYAFTNIVPGQVFITPRTASFTLPGFTKGYGDTNPSVNVLLSNFYSPDGIIANANPTVNTNSVPGSYTNAFNLDVNPTNRLGNYNLSTNMGNINITNALVNLSVDDANKVYGDSNPAFTGSLTGDKLNQLTLGFSTPAGTNSNVGNSPIYPVVNGATNVIPYYDFITNRIGNLTINKAPLNVSSDSKSKIYGQLNPGFTGSVIGKKNNDNLSLTFNTSAGTNSIVGNYLIGININDPDGKLGNYNTTTNNGILTVNKAGLSVNIDNKTREYGEPNGNLTGGLVGLVNGDSVSMNLSTPAMQGSDVGVYSIIPNFVDSNGKLVNYQPITNGGNLTISKAPLNVKADDKTRRVNENNPGLTFNASGFKLGQGNEAFTSFPLLSTPAVQGSLPGNYSIYVSGGNARNYQMSYEAGNMNILSNMLPPLINGINYSNGNVNINAEVFADNTNGMRIIPLCSDNLFSTNWLPTGVTNMIYPNVVNNTNQNQTVGISIPSQISSGRFYRIKLEDNK